MKYKACWKTDDFVILFVMQALITTRTVQGIHIATTY